MFYFSEIVAWEWYDIGALLMILTHEREAGGVQSSVRQIVCHFVPNLSNVKVFTWNSSVLEITLGQWAHDVVSWHFSTKDSLISGPAPTLHTNVSSGRLCPCIHPITSTDVFHSTIYFHQKVWGHNSLGVNVASDSSTVHKISFQ